MQYALEERSASDMMDLLMVGTLLVCFGLIWLLTKWCQKQVDEQE